jgi:ubiquinone biosynthesis protein Coq4
MKDVTLKEKLLALKTTSIRMEGVGSPYYMIPLPLVNQILSLISKTIEEAIPKESHINYHIENGIEYRDQTDIGISIHWEKGFNNALKQVRDTLREKGLIT